ncbi:MAG: MFS transporter [Myxococcota bacterium]
MTLHYAWLIVASAFFGLLISNGLAIGGLQVFDGAILAEFGWSRGAYKFGPFLTFAIAGICGPLIGWIADRQGVRRLMVVGALVLAVGLYGFSYMESLFHLYIIHSLFGLALACAGLVVNVMLVSRWFAKKRGTAIGLALVGTSAGAIVFPLINNALITAVGWRQAFAWLGIFPLLLIPVIAGVIREWPGDRGLAPYGAAPKSATAQDAPSPRAQGMPYLEALRSRDFWLLAAIAMSTFYVVLGVLQNLFLHLLSLDFTAPQAARGLAAFGVMALVGKFALGFLADYLDPKKVLIGGLATMLAGCLCLTSMSSTLLWPFLILFGLGWGGLYTMIQLLVVVRFGLRDSGKILGTITILDAIGGGLGPFLTGVLHDRSGDYQSAFIGMSALLATALALSFLLRTRSADSPLPAARART